MNNREKWIQEIKEYTGEEDTWNVIQLSLSYTLQACRNNDLDRYKWENDLYKENKELRLLVKTLKEQNMKLKLRLEDLGVEYL